MAEVRANIGFNQALTNIQLFNRLRGNDSVANFSYLDVDANNKLIENNTTSNAARFAATLFFGLGLVLGYRNENKTRSLRVQNVLKLSVDALKETDPTTISREQKRLRATALVTFNATIFQNRSTILPPPFIANFYYWVLGLNNTNFNEADKKIIYSTHSRTEVLAAEGALQSLRANQKLVRAHYRETPTTPLIPFASDFPQLSYARPLIAVANAVGAAREAALGEVLTPLQSQYKDLMKQRITALEKAEATAVGCATTQESENLRDEVRDVQSEYIERNIDDVVAKLRKIDIDLANAAVRAGYINRTAVNAIDRYYRHLSNHPQQAGVMRREAAANMTKLYEEVKHEILLEIAGDKDRATLPGIITEIVEAMTAINPENGMASLQLLVFKVIGNRINAKINRYYADEVNGPNKPLIEYQAVMLGLKGFGLSNMLIDKCLKKYVELAKPYVTGLDLISEVTVGDQEFSAAFKQYVLATQAEQQTNVEMMKRIKAGENVTGDAYGTRFMEMMANDRQMVAHESVANPLALPDVDINSLGIPSENPQLKAAELSFLQNLVSGLVWYGFKVFMHNRGRYYRDGEFQLPYSPYAQNAPAIEQQRGQQRGIGGRTFAYLAN